MRFVDPPSLDAARQRLPGDDLDGLLSAFFRNELPSPWPEAPRVEETPVILRPAQARRSSLRSRLALAASVALLVSGPWFLGDSFRHTAGPRRTGISLDSGSADTRDRTDTGRPVRVRQFLQNTREGMGVRIVIEELPEDSVDKPSK